MIVVYDVKTWYPIIKKYQEYLNIISRNIILLHILDVFIHLFKFKYYLVVLNLVLGN